MIHGLLHEGVSSVHVLHCDPTSGTKRSDTTTSGTKHSDKTT